MLNLNRAVVVRILADLFLLVISLTIPWWLVAPVIILATMIFGSFYEAVVFGFIFDLVYSPMSDALWIGNFYGTILGLAIFVFAQILKRHLLFYNR